MKKVCLVAFRGDAICFIHVLLNGLDMAEKGMAGKIILEGEAVTLVSKMARPDHFLNQLYRKAREKDLLVGACRACSSKLKATAAVEAEGIELIGDMSGHPALSFWLNQGYTILTF